jgi:hypothetical protein
VDKLAPSDELSPEEGEEGNRVNLGRHPKTKGGSI